MQDVIGAGVGRQDALGPLQAEAVGGPAGLGEYRGDGVLLAGQHAQDVIADAVGHRGDAQVEDRAPRISLACHGAARRRTGRAVDRMLAVATETFGQGSTRDPERIAQVKQRSVSSLTVNGPAGPLHDIRLASTTEDTTTRLEAGATAIETSVSSLVMVPVAELFTAATL